MARTQAHLDRIVIGIRTCEAQLAARRELLAVFRAGGQPTCNIEHSIAVKEIELALLKLRREEIADKLFPGWQSRKAA